MSKIYIKDIKKMCSCIAGLSCQTIRTNEKGAFNKGYIYAYIIYPYGNCITFQFIENEFVRPFNADFRVIAADKVKQGQDVLFSAQAAFNGRVARDFEHPQAGPQLAVGQNIVFA